MDRIIQEEATDRGRGVNFQKASCTIDASIKIYANRVDDTWSTSYRILENLNRNDGGKGSQLFLDEDATGNHDDDDDDDGDNGDKNHKNMIKKSKKSKSRILSSTIEKNVNAINLSASEMAGASPHADPMFHKMSQLFDEGGAKGMLLTNLVIILIYLSLEY